jgi:hypothetical protein
METPTGLVQAAVSYSQLLFRMQNATPGLIVLDGLEKVQEDGTRGIFGQLSAPNLRDFVTRAANGYFPNLSLLITTRFPLADLQEDPPDFFDSIPIEEIDLPTGISLLRQRGVQGNHLELERIVKECGCHALTVDLAGGYITEYGNGDPSTPLTLGTPEELEAEAQQEPDPAKRARFEAGQKICPSRPALPRGHGAKRPRCYCPAGAHLPVSPGGRGINPGNHLHWRECCQSFGRSPI